MAFMEFKIVSPYQPTGDQPEAIGKSLAQGSASDGLSAQTLLGDLPGQVKHLPWLMSSKKFRNRR